MSHYKALYKSTDTVLYYFFYTTDSKLINPVYSRRRFLLHFYFTSMATV